GKLSNFVASQESLGGDFEKVLAENIEGLYVPGNSAPPAPVSVPTFDEWLEIRGTKPLGWVKDAMRESYDACCAAMLQGADGNSQWVACSERMPEDEQEVITHNIFGYRHVSFFDEHSGNFFDRLDGSPVDCVEHVLVSHWMPLPAAPQQEVK
ncbi:DUF551 domain-containing protein, partial [Enterobacter asburiae]|uniref:DUF551 domain-containing protein n=1 Tax=Enterobacter asburiae TaxID=61645 RepID=UPI003F432943